MGAYNFVLFFVLLTKSFPVGSFIVQFFQDYNFTDMFYENDLKLGTCNNIPDYLDLHYHYNGIWGSARTEECIMIFSKPSCKGYSRRLLPGEDHLDSWLPDTRRQPGNYLLPTNGSYRACNEKDFNAKTPVNLYKEENHKGLIAKYLDVCGCLRLPDHVIKNGIRSVDNHGQCVILHANKNCDEASENFIIEHGFSEESLKIEPIYQSISNCAGLNGCAKLRSTITAIEIITDESNERSLKQTFTPERRQHRNNKDTGFSTDGIDMSAKSVFINNGTGTLWQIYTATKTIKETAKVKVVDALTSVTEKEYEAGVKASFNVPQNPAISVEGYLNACYTDTNTTSSETGNTHELSTEKRFSVSHKIKVPACTMYVVNAKIQMIQGFPLEYEIYSKISGRINKKPVNAADLKTIVQEKRGLIYLRDIDENTVLVKARSTLTMLKELQLRDAN